MSRFARWAGIAALVFSSSFGVVGCSCSEGGKAAKDLNLDYSPRTIDFGTVAILQEAWVTVTLTHVGFSGTIEFGDIRIEGGSAEFSFDLPERMALEPGESTSITVRYNPVDSQDDGGALIIRHNVAQQNNETRIPITAGGFFADLVVNPNPIDFDRVPQGSQKDLDVILKNVGSDQVVIRQIMLDLAGSPDFGILDLVLPDGDTLPVTLRPDESMGVVMRYTPRNDDTNPAQDASVLRVEGDSKGTKSWAFDVVGGELGPRLIVTPGQVDFQWVELNATENRLLMLENAGNADLVVQDAYLVPGSNGDLSLPDKPESAFTLKPGDSRDMFVRWNPKAAFPESADPIGTLAIVSNDVTSPTTLHVYGRVDSPVINVVPSAMDFGFGAQLLPVERTLTIRNDGHGVLKVSGLVVQDAVPTQYGEEFAFSVPSSTPKNSYGEYEIKGNSSMAVTLSFTNKGPGTGSASARLKITSNSAGTETVFVPLSAQRAVSPECKLTLSPASLTFGTVPAGFTKELPINLVNTGSGPCGFKSARIEDCVGFGGMFSQCTEPGMALQSSLFTFLSMPVPSQNGIPPGATVTLRVRFAPKTANSIFGELNTFAALLSVVGYDPVSKQDIRIPTGTTGGTGTTYSPNISAATGTAKVSVLPANIDFGLVTIGCFSQTHRVCVYNTGSAALTITEIKMAGCSPEFRAKNVPKLPREITSAGPICFELVYAPQDLTQDECTVQVTSNDQSSPSMSIGIKGKGTYETEQTDVFEQVSGQAVDILFVIDDSGSMCEEQERMIKNFNSFISQAEVWNNDYHIGVISVNVVNDAVMGKLNRGATNVTPRYITKNSNAQSQFARLADIGCNGNSDAQEAALQAAQAALTAPLVSETGVSCGSDSDCRNNKNLCSSSTNCPYYCIDGTCGGWNKGFIRQDAQLEIVALSDEEDQSSGTPDFYVDFLKSLKGYYNINMMHFNAIVGTNTSGDGTCTSPDGSTRAAEGKRYIDVANRTNGQVGSICDPDYDVIMNEIGSIAFGLKVQFYLSRLADPPTVEVRVNDVLCPSGWRYDAPSNSVIFDDEGACMPQPGDIIKIHYDTLCLKG